MFEAVFDVMVCYALPGIVPRPRRRTTQWWPQPGGCLTAMGVCWSPRRQVCGVVTGSAAGVNGWVLMIYA